MDVDLARTFLAVVETGSFAEAANRVFVSQSTVSTRIRTLEDRLGKVLFARGKGGAALTAAGSQFLRHAQSMVRVWEHARLEIALPDGYEAALNVGGQYSLWDGFLLTWLAETRRKSPEVAIRAQMGFSDTLMQGLVDGILDLCVMYTPQGRSGFEVELLFEDTMILVSADPDVTELPAHNYVMIDWGPEFRADHALNFPQISVPGTYLELGSLSLQYLVNTGSSGYVPKRLVGDLLASGRLTPIEGAPTFSYPAYAVYPTESGAEFKTLVLSELRKVAKAVGAG